jgi:hypothetical protein
MISAISSSRFGIEASVDITKKATSSIRRQQRQWDHDQAGEAAHQQRHPGAVQREVQHVAAQDVGPEQVASGAIQRRPAVELDRRERRGIALLVEVERKGAIDHGARPVQIERVAADGVGASHPGDRVEQRHQQIEAHHRQRDRAPPRQLDRGRPPQIAAAHPDRSGRRARHQQRDHRVRDDVGFHAAPYSNRTRGSTSV